MQRGRKSTASLAVVAPLVTRIIPQPPQHLTAQQAETWRLVLSSPAGELIPHEAYPVVVEYCRAIESADQVAAQRAALMERWHARGDPSAIMGDEVMKRMEKLDRMQERFGRLVASLSVKLRLSPSTQVHPEKAGTQQRHALRIEPWQIE